jgi:hypothetical protein
MASDDDEVVGMVCVDDLESDILSSIVKMGMENEPKLTTTEKPTAAVKG